MGIVAPQRRIRLGQFGLLGVPGRERHNLGLVRRATRTISGRDLLRADTLRTRYGKGMSWDVSHESSDILASNKGIERTALDCERKSGH